MNWFKYVKDFKPDRAGLNMKDRPKAKTGWDNFLRVQGVILIIIGLMIAASGHPPGLGLSVFGLVLIIVGSL